MTPGLGRKMTAQERGGAGVDQRPRILLTNSSMKAHVAEEESGELRDLILLRRWSLKMINLLQTQGGSSMWGLTLVS